VYNRFGYPTKYLSNKVGQQTLYDLPIDPFYYCRIFDTMDKKNYPLPKRQNTNLGVHHEDKELFHLSGGHRCPQEKTLCPGKDPGDSRDHLPYLKDL
jgi:hypothetical protein